MRGVIAGALLLALSVASACGGPARRRRRLVAYEYEQCRQHIAWLTERGHCDEISACTPDRVCWETQD